MRRGSATLLVVLFAMSFLPAMTGEHADGCACPPASCRCDHAGADACGTATSGSDCAMEACDKSARTMTLPSVIVPDSCELSIPGSAGLEVTTQPCAVERPRELSDPPPRPFAC